MFQIGWKNLIKKVKNTLPRRYDISDLNGQEIVGTFYDNKLQKTNQKELKKQSREKVINYMLHGKAMMIL